MQNNSTILYIEDTFENRILIRRVLQAEGFTVVEAENATHALEVINDVDPDLILIDVNMPDMDGYTLTSHLRTIPKLASIPIVALTANVMRGDRERSLAVGCDDYIQKPINVDTLPQQISSYLNK